MRTRGKRLTQEKIIEQFKEAHGDYYDYSLVEFKTVWDKVVIICPRHGKFEQPPKRHRSGGRCRSCYLEDVNGKFMRKPEYRKWASENMKKQQSSLKSGMIAKYGKDNPSLVESIRIKRRKTFLEKYGVENPFLINVEERIEKTKKTKIENGIWLKDEDRKPFDLYKKRVRESTNKSIIEFDAYWILEKRAINENHIDHIYSIKDGYVNNIPFWLVGSIVNLQSINSNQNRSKGSSSWISVEDLITAYKIVYCDISKQKHQVLDKLIKRQT